MIFNGTFGRVALLANIIFNPLFLFHVLTFTWCKVYVLLATFRYKNS